MIIYLAARIYAPTAMGFKARHRLDRLRRISAAIEAENPETQVMSPHIGIADATGHDARPPLDLLTEHAQALLVGLALHAQAVPATVYVVDPEQGPSVAQQLQTARDLGLPIERPDAGTLARLEFGVTAEPKPRDEVGREADGPEDRRYAWMNVRYVDQLLRAYYDGAEGCCGARSVNLAGGGGGSRVQARRVAEATGIQIAQAAGVMRAAQKDRRWVGRNSRGSGGCVMAIEDRLRYAARSDAVVRAKYLDMTWEQCGEAAGCSASSAKRAHVGAMAAIRDALADRIALRVVEEEEVEG